MNKKQLRKMILSGLLPQMRLPKKENVSEPSEQIEVVQPPCEEDSRQSDGEEERRTEES